MGLSGGGCCRLDVFEGAVQNGVAGEQRLAELHARHLDRDVGLHARAVKRIA